MYKNKKIVATIEARMTSTRLPGKVLMNLAGRPALERMIERVRRSKYLDEIVVATTINKADEPIVKLANRIDLKYFRGSEMDVLARVVGAAQSVKADLIVELTGDCPLMDWRLVDRGIKEFFRHPCDCAANIVMRSFPDGFDVQVYPAKLLAQVAKLTDDPLDREHVSRYIYQNEDKKYKIRHWLSSKKYFWPQLRITLDEKDDYILINRIFEALLNKKQDFSYIDVINFLRNNPDLLKINQHVKAKKI